MHINYPNITSYNQDFEMDRSEQSTLKGILKVSDVVVNIYSTINIEASIFDKPLINIDFDNMMKMYSWKKKPERQDINIDRNLDHNSRVMKLGGIKNVKNEEELINAINFYLQTPSADYKNEKNFGFREVEITKDMQVNLLQIKFSVFYNEVGIISNYGFIYSYFSKNFLLLCLYQGEY